MQNGKYKTVLWRSFCVSLIIGLGFPFGLLPSAKAAVPQVINYQSRLRDASLNPITALTNIQYTLYDHPTNGAFGDAESSSGPVLWKEVHDGVSCPAITPDADGYFAVQLGACVAFPSYIDFNDPLYLGVRIGTDAEAAPRVLFAAHPYSLNAETVDTLHATSTATANQLLALDNNLNFNISTGTFYGGGLLVNGSSTLQNLTFTVATGTSLELDSYLAIGAIRLDAVGTSNVSSGAYLVGIFDEFDNSNATTVQGALRDLDIGLSAVSSSLSAFDLQAVTDNGNTTTNSIQFAGGTSTADFNPSTTDSLSLGSSSTRWSDLWASALHVGTSTWGLSQADDRSFRIDGGGTERLTILDTNGNVGIGTSTPSDALYVYGGRNFGNLGLTIENNPTIAGNSSLTLKRGGFSAEVSYTGAGASLAIRTQGGSNSSIEISANGSGNLYLRDNGNVGIGNSAPDFRLQVAGHAGPQVHGTFDLGSATTSWRNIYAGLVTTTQLFVNGQEVYGGSSTLDTAYDAGGAGLGRFITTDAGPIQITNTTGTLGFLSVQHSVNAEGLWVNNLGSGNAFSARNMGSSAGFYSRNQGTGSGMRIDNNTPNGLGVWVDNPDTGTSIQVDNYSSGMGLLVNNSGSGFGQRILNTGSGMGINIQNSSATGLGLYVRQNDGFGIQLDNNTDNSGFVLNNNGTGRGIDIYNDSDDRGFYMYDVGGKTGFQIDKPLNGGNAIELSVADGARSFYITQAGTGEGFWMRNTGTGASLWIEDSGSDSSPFILDADGRMGISATNTANFMLTVGGSAGPSVHNAYDLGSATASWRNIYAQMVTTTQLFVNGQQVYGGSTTLDTAYDGGGSGAGRFITADAGPITITGLTYTQGALNITNTTDSQAVYVNNTGVGNAFSARNMDAGSGFYSRNQGSGDGFRVDNGTNGGRGLYVENNMNGTGAFVNNTGGGDGVIIEHSGNRTGLRINNTGAGRGAYVRNDTGTGFEIDNYSDTYYGMHIHNRSTGYGMYVQSAGGSGIYIDDTGSKAGLKVNTITGTGNMIELTNGDDARPIYITHTGTQEGFWMRNTGTGPSLWIEDEASETTPFVLDDRGNLGVSTTNTTNFALTVGGDAGPDAHDAFDLGSSEYAWRNLYAQGFVSTTALYINGQLVSPTSTDPNLQAVTDNGNTTTNAIQFAGGTSTSPFVVYDTNNPNQSPALNVYTNQASNIFRAANSDDTKGLGIGVDVYGSDLSLNYDEGQHLMVSTYFGGGAGYDYVFLGNRHLTVRQASGFVGIGTEDPANRLDVVGAISIASSTPATSTYALYNLGGELYWNGIPISSASSLVDSDGDTKVEVEASPDEDVIRFSTSGTERMYIGKDGRVGIATTAPLVSMLTVGPDSHEASSFSVSGIDGMLNIANFRDKNGENVFRAAGSVADNDLVVGFGDIDYGGNGTGIKIDYASNSIKLSNSQLRFYENASTGDYVGFIAPASLTTSTIWTLPSADGTGGQVLSTNGLGLLSWATSSASSANIYNTDGTIPEARNVTISNGNELRFVDEDNAGNHIYLQTDYNANGNLKIGGRNNDEGSTDHYIEFLDNLNLFSTHGVDIDASTSQVDLRGDSGILMIGGASHFSDQRAAGSRYGLRYESDYSADFIDRSLVDKGFVVNYVGSSTGALNLQQVTNNGNSTTNTIQFAGGTSTNDFQIYRAANAANLTVRSGNDDAFLTVQGNGGASAIRLSSNNGANWSVIESGSDGSFNLTADGNIVAWADGPTGFLGVGENNPSSRLHVTSGAASTTPVMTLQSDAGDFQVFDISATPQGSVTGSRGDLAIDSSNGRLFIKETGVGTNTGWSMLATGTMPTQHWQKNTNVLSPADSSVYQLSVTNNSNSTLTGFKAVNTNDANNYAGAVIELKGSGADFTNNMYFGKYGAGFYIPSWAGNGVLATDKNLVMSAVGASSQMVFQVTGGYTAPLNVMTLTGAGLAFSTGTRIKAFYDDVTLSADSSTAVATQHAVKTYVDNQIASSTSGLTLQAVTDNGQSTTDWIQFAGATSTADFTLNGSLYLADGVRIYTGNRQTIAMDLNNNYFAGTGNTAATGIGNVGVGVGALAAVTSGFVNTAVGTAALQANTEGTSNQAFGYLSLRNNTTGSENTAVGRSALDANIDGNFNLALGNSALSANSSGSNNVGVGYATLDTNTLGSGNVALGHGADVGSNNLTNAIAIGYLASVDQSDSMALGGTGAYSVNVGIATTTPGYRLDVFGDARVSAQFMLGQFASLPATGTQAGALVYNSASSSVHFWDGSSWIVFATGTNSGALGLQQVTDNGNLTTNAIQFAGGTSTGNFNPSVTNSLSLGSSSTRWSDVWTANLHLGTSTWDLGQSSNSGLAFNTSGSEKMRITNDGFVGVGTDAPTHRLDIVSKATADDLFRVASGDNGGYLSVYMTPADDRSATIEFQRNLSFTSNGFGSEMLTLTNDAVGINTDAPTQALSVVGDAIIGQFDGMIYPIGGTNHSLAINAVDGQLAGIQGTANLVFQRNQADLARLGIDTSNRLLFQDYNGASWDTNMTVASSGSVGIGTLLPGAKLQINADNSASDASLLKFQSSADSDIQSEIYFAGGANATYWDINSSGAGGALILMNEGTEISQFVNNGVIINDGGASNVDFRIASVSDTHAFFVDATNGYTGFDQSAPQSKLHVGNTTAGSAADYNYLRLEGNGDVDHSLYLPTGSNLMVWDFNMTGNGGAIEFRNNGSRVGMFTNSGLVINDGGVAGVGLRVEGDTNANLLYTSAANDRIGVGTSSPAVRLHVTQSGDTVAAFDRSTSDGTIVSIRQDGVEEGTISVSGNTVSYNAFTGSHYAWASSAIEKGMLVSLTGVNRRLHDSPNSEIVYGIEKTSQANHDRVMGAYLSILNPSESQSSDNPSLVMAVGNGEVWVVDNGSDIKAGDYLVSSEVVGHAEKDLRTTDKSYVVARAAEDVTWGDVGGAVDGRKHKLVSVFFENFTRDNSTGALLQGQQAGEQLAADSVVVVEDYEFQGRVVVKGHLTFGGDSVGQAKILSGQTEVRVIFDEEYATQPIVTVTPLDFVDAMYRVADVNTKGFIIQLNSTQGNDKLFNWHAFGNDDGKVFVSDGSTSTVQVIIRNDFLPLGGPAVVAPLADETEVADEPSTDSSPEPTVDQSPSTAEATEPEADASSEPSIEPVVEAPQTNEPTTPETVLSTDDGEASSGSGSTETPVEPTEPGAETVTP